MVQLRIVLSHAILMSMKDMLGRLQEHLQPYILSGNVYLVPRNSLRPGEVYVTASEAIIGSNNGLSNVAHFSLETMLFIVNLTTGGKV